MLKSPARSVAPKLRSKAAARKSTPKVGFVSLGCPKALVDSERIITRLRSEGYEIARDYGGADVVVVNTCGFLNSAKQESLEAIGEALAENGRVIVTGCLGVEKDRILAEHPGVLAVTGPHQYEAVMEAVHEAVPPVHDPFVDLVPPEGLRLTPRHYAYLKISEGCNNRCSFCIIPSLRGRLASRPAAHVMTEAERLVKAGVKELLVISQDTSAYGLDIKYAESMWKGAPLKAKFFDLTKALGSLGAWVRLHYVYPYPHVDDVLPLMADGLVLPYLDIPFQHASPTVLKAMRRPAHQEKTAERIRTWRQAVPDLAIRSTFIVGFPGETEGDFDLLLQWIKEARINRAGCFKYEPVDGAAANDLTWCRARGGEGGTLAPLHGSTAGRQPHAHGAKSRTHHRRAHRYRGRRQNGRAITVGRARDRRQRPPRQRKWRQARRHRLRQGRALGRIRSVGCPLVET